MQSVVCPVGTQRWTRSGLLSGEMKNLEDVPISPSIPDSTMRGKGAGQQYCRQSATGARGREAAQEADVLISGN